jgi:hypothetical protein
MVAHAGGAFSTVRCWRVEPRSYKPPNLAEERFLQSINKITRYDSALWIINKF